MRSVHPRSILDPVNVKYSACFPPGFGSAAATTMGSEIYVKAPAARLDSNPTWTMSLSNGFVSQTQILLHELGHTRQYHDRNWNIGVFGYDYMFQYCKAGFSYSKNSMEVAADTYRYKADALYPDKVISHFKKWRKDNLALVAGYSLSQKEYASTLTGGQGIESLDLTPGTGQTRTGESQRKAGTNCVRYLGSALLSQRLHANIASAPWDCVNVPPTPKPTGKPTHKPTKKPTGPPTPIVIGIPHTPPQLAPTPKPIAR
jgi:hypothetical protein